MCGDLMKHDEEFWVCGGCEHVILFYSLEEKALLEEKVVVL